MELRYKTSILARDLFLNISHEEARIVRAHIAAHGDSSYLLVKIAIESVGIEGQHKFSKTGLCRSRWLKNETLVKEVG